MEEKKMFTEKESLELISQMIQMTKENLERGSGNDFSDLWICCSSAFYSCICSRVYHRQTVVERLVVFDVYSCHCYESASGS